MTRASFAGALALGVVVTSVLCASCEKPVGSEGGPCTSGGGCDPGLVCLSDLCVNPVGEGEGEGGEGEGEEPPPECLGDAPGSFDADDCNAIPAAACGPLEENAILTTCRDAGLILREQLFDGAYNCIRQIPTTSCDAPDDELAACFGALEACPFQPAVNICNLANDACAEGGQPDFPLELCIIDMTATNLDHHTAYADCFNEAANAGEPCATIHDFCYSFALATLIQASGG